MSTISNLRNDAVSPLIGNTPLIDLGHIAGDQCARVMAKAENKNFGGSVKDRICRSIIDTAEAEGRLKPGGTIVEATSGNTGIGLAMISAARGYQCVLTMPSSMSQERVSLLRSYGAEVVLCSDEGGMSEALLRAEKISKERGAFMASQFENPANPRAHILTTGPEILASVPAEDIAAFVAGVGTGGTISGCGEVLKGANEQIQIVAVEPSKSPIISGGKPGAHGIQGIGAGFIPDTLNLKLLDEVLTIDEESAWAMKNRLGHEFGVLVGISAGANVAVAKQVAKRFDASKVVVTVLCDTGERYLSMAQ